MRWVGMGHIYVFMARVKHNYMNNNEFVTLVLYSWHVYYMYDMLYMSLLHVPYVHFWTPVLLSIVLVTKHYNVCFQCNCEVKLNVLIPPCIIRCLHPRTIWLLHVLIYICNHRRSICYLWLICEPNNLVNKGKPSWSLL